MESILEFGALDLHNNKKSVWDIRSGQQAYDWFMCARYMNDLLTYSRMLNECQKSAQPPYSKIFDDYKKNIHHASTDLSLNFDKWCALQCLSQEDVSFFELGSTLFGCIEGIEFVQAYFNSLKQSLVDNKQVKWVGVDNSDYLNQTAMQLHQAENVQLFTNLAEIQFKNSVFFAKGVSLLYAIGSINEFAQIMQQTEICMFDYSFSTEEIVNATIGTGKDVTYYSLEQFLHQIPNDKVCYVREDSIQLNGNLLFVELIVATPVMIESFFNKQNEYLNIIKKQQPEHQVLFSRAELLKEICWLPLQECVSQIKKL